MATIADKVAGAKQQRAPVRYERRPWYELGAQAAQRHLRERGPNYKSYPIGFDPDDRKEYFIDMRPY